MNAQFADMHAALFDRFSVPVTVQRGAALPVASRVVQDDGVASIGEYGQVIGRVTKLSFIKAEWNPARGDVVTFDDGSALKVEAIDTDDGIVVEAVMHG
jgi:hypothetical protein